MQLRGDQALLTCHRAWGQQGHPVMGMCSKHSVAGVVMAAIQKAELAGSPFQRLGHGMSSGQLNETPFENKN